jgi:hypothetical protein
MRRIAERNPLVEAILTSSRKELGLGVDIYDPRGNAFSVLAATVEFVQTKTRDKS